MSAKEAVKNLLVELMGLEEGDIKPGADFRQDLNTDPLELAEFLSDLQTKLKIELTEEELGSIKTVGDLIAIVSEHLDEIDA